MLLIKTRQGDHHIFDDMKKAGEFVCEYPEDIANTYSYDSVMDYIKDEYMHNDLCMTELLRSISKEVKLDLEQVIAAMCWAGEDDATVHTAIYIINGGD